ncbi:unnamed protein product, partial [Vitis vinifera]|uniref:Uncharacterized protein n=1 Tax=Vitis vinifera TaxID=29760 RepID=D7TDJ1_VITVI
MLRLESSWISNLPR